MNNIITYGRHFFKAKGRHGTHSPFVYAFVEEVLRSRKKLDVDFRRLIAQPGFSKKELTLLIKTILYLNTRKIYCEPQFEPVLNYINSLLQRQDQYEVKLLDSNFGAGSEGSQEAQILVFATLKKDIVAQMKLSLSKQAIAWLVPRPKQHEACLQYWNEVCALPAVKMKLDFWYYGLLMNHEVFKASQYFYLK